MLQVFFLRAQFPMAAHMVLNGDFDGAKSYYEKILAKDSMNFGANQELGLLLVQYYDNKGEALKYIDRAINIAEKKGMISELYLGYAQALHFHSQYKKAIEYYDKIPPLLVGKPEGERLKVQVGIWIQNCYYGIKHPMTKKTDKYVLKNVGGGINTAYPEFIPHAAPDNSVLLYTARRNIVLGDKKDGPEDRSHGDMFISTNTTGRFESGMPFYKPNYKVSFLEQTKELDDLIAISTNGEHVLLDRADQLYISHLVEDKWSEPSLLPATINVSPKFDGGACISNDGKTIYFSSDKVGGYGGRDLYRSVLAKNGNWAEAENLGEGINTSEDEDGPALNFTENDFYFSSKGLTGYGGYDVFRAFVFGREITKASNMGLPFNSPADDIYFRINKDQTEGYMASSRKGGMGDLDIYHVLCFEMPAPCAPLTNSSPGDAVYLNLNFPDSVFLNDFVNCDASASSVKNGKIYRYFWSVNDTMLVADTSIFTAKYPRADKYKITLQAAVYSEADESRKDLCITKELHVFNPNAVHSLFEPLVKANEEKMAISGTLELGSLKIDTTKTQLLSIKLEPVFFNTNKFDLRKDAKEAIKRNVNKMKVDATIVVKLTALADPRAGKDYNLKLSQKRANSVVSALEKSGIKRKRILAVLALGEEEANEKACKGDPECLDKIFQQNRRVEFKIVGTEIVPSAKASPKKASQKKAVKKTKAKK